MTKHDYMIKVNENADRLRSLIGQWHPLSRALRVPQVQPVEVAGTTIGVEIPFVITAPAAQQACNEICYQIEKENAGDPLERFDKAIAVQDCGTIDLLLNEAWFGVPESTSCWQITGFAEAVDLMEDPVEEEASNETNR